MKILHSKPTVSMREVKAVQAVLKSGLIAKGKKVEAFENQMCTYLGMKNAVAVNSGTSALHMALLALGVKEKDEVIIPSYVCVAVLNAVLFVGAIPIVVDVNEHDGNIFVKEVQKNITKKTKAMIVVHSFGMPADILSLKKCGIPIIEDCAQAVGANVNGQPVGSFGDVCVFSFYATKMITTGEGGMVVSNNKKLVDRVRDLTDYDQRESFKLRYNYKMSDIQATMGIEQLKQLPQFILKRQKIAKQYRKNLEGVFDFLPQDFEKREHIYYRYNVRFLKKKTFKKIMPLLQEEGIDVRKPIFKPLHKMIKSQVCPVSDHLMQTNLSIPIYPSLPDKHVKYVIQKIISVCL